MESFQLTDGVAQLVREVHQPIDGIETTDVSGFLERVGEARVVLFGGATQGTSEFYRWRARLTRELIKHRGFTIIAAEADCDAGQHPLYAGSILAHGTVDNIAIVTPPPPVAELSGGFNGALWQVQFTSRTNWLYTLERSGNSATWTNVSLTALGNSALLTLTDTNPPAGAAFYRVKANRP